MASSSGCPGGAAAEAPAREASLADGGAPLRIGVVGAGAMGRRHVRVLSHLGGVELAGVYDPAPGLAAAVAHDYGVRWWPSLEELAAWAEAAVVAVPTTAHAAVGCELLERGLHVLVEKPMAGSLADADRLLAAAGGRVLAVGHTEFFNPAVQALLALDQRPRFIEVQRLAAFTPRSLDVDVILDLMIHDLQIVHALDSSALVEVRATGVAVLSAHLDIATVRLELASGCVANVTASRVSAERVRKLRVFVERGYYSVDYHRQQVKGLRLVEAEGGPRIEPQDPPLVECEPLVRELEAFAAACRGQPARLVDGNEGRRALATALAVVEAAAGRRAAEPA